MTAVLRLTQCLCLALAAASLLFTGPAAARDRIVNTENPAFVAFSLNIEIFSGYMFWGGPRTHVSGNEITVYLNAECGFLCPSSTVRSMPVPLPALAPGEYRVRVYESEYLSGGGKLHIDATFRTTAGPNYQGLWWRPEESGWGVNIAHQAETLFATWFTYDQDGRDLWLVMPTGAYVSRGVYEGPIYRASAAPGGALPFNLATSAEMLHVGNGRFTFSGTNQGEFTYIVNGVVGSKAITRQVFAPGAHTCVTAGAIGATASYQDLWWNAPAGSEAGWGLNITHQGDVLFATVFGYDPAGRPTWMVMPDARRDANGAYSGTLYRTRGSPVTGAWNPAALQVTPIGTGTLSFSGRDAGNFAYRLDGVAEVRKTLTRQRFGAAETACQ